MQIHYTSAVGSRLDSNQLPPDATTLRPNLPIAKTFGLPDNPAMASSNLDRDAWSLLDTPATLYTGEVAVKARFSIDQDKAQRIPSLGDLYNAGIAVQKRVSEFGLYQCTRIEISGEYGWATYSKPKTDAEAMRPYKEPETDFGNHYWPPILYGVDIERRKLQSAVNVGGSIQRGNQYTATPIWSPSIDTGSTFITRHFLSPTAFAIPPWPTIVTRSVNFPVPGQGMFSFPEHLGLELIIPAMQECADSYDTATAGVTSRVGLTQERTFKATDPATWVNIILSDRQSQTAAGAWHRIQVEVQPPAVTARILGR